MSAEYSFQSLFEAFTTQLAAVVFYAFSFNGVDIPLVMIWLISGAIIFTLYLGFINIRGFRYAISRLFAKPERDSAGEISPYKALTTALSGTVGTGNIAGVAIAISLGGPGATFWMIMAGLLGMSTKFVECTLAVKYRQQNADGSISG
ncbi:alanine:cation symporter family protein, partial [Alishewanella sp. SMS9]|nr:alanine:cation symporter family protein [Alishewanella sp. SMS9]